MNIEDVRMYALGLDERVTEELFAGQWIAFRIGGKWFLLVQLDVPEPRVAVKLPLERAAELRERYEGVKPAFHMNKRHWSDLYLNSLDGGMVKDLIAVSFGLVESRLPKRTRGQKG